MELLSQKVFPKKCDPKNATLKMPSKKYHPLGITICDLSEAHPPFLRMSKIAEFIKNVLMHFDEETDPFYYKEYVFYLILFQKYPGYLRF